MYKWLRIIFAVLAAVLVAACVFVAILWDMLPFWICLAGAVLFFLLSLLFKYLQEESEGRAKSALDVAREQQEAQTATARRAETPAAKTDEAEANADADEDSDGGNAAR